MRILILAPDFDVNFVNPSLIEDLVDGMLDRGFHLDVISLNWYGKYDAGKYSYRDSNVYVIPPQPSDSIYNKINKWLFISLQARKIYKSLFIASDKFDLLISFSPSIIFKYLFNHIYLHVPKRCLIQWDFFPFHQHQINLIPKFIPIFLLKKIENNLMNKYTDIYCMSEKNVEFIVKNYRLSKAIRLDIIPIWSKIRKAPIVDRSIVRKLFNLPENRFICVFGGQLGPGRGIDFIIKCSEISHTKNIPITFLLVGDGPYFDMVANRSVELGCSLMLKPKVYRDEYLKLISACDIGIVVTVPKVSVPSFPSKSLDYCCVSLPIIAAVEKSTDYGNIIESLGLGICADRYDANSFVEGLVALLQNPKHVAAMKTASRAAYENYFSVDNAISKILNEKSAS